MHYSLGNEHAWFDLEGIGDDGMGYEVDFIPDRALNGKSSQGQMSTQSGTATLRGSEVYNMNNYDETREWFGNGNDEKTAKVWRVDHPAETGSPPEYSETTPLTLPKAYAAPHKHTSPEEPPAPKRKQERSLTSPRRGPLNPFNSSQKWAGPRARKSMRSSTNGEPTLPILTTTK